MNSRQRRVARRRGEDYTTAWARARTAADAAARALGKFGRSFMDVTQAVKAGWIEFSGYKEELCPKCGVPLAPLLITKELVVYRILGPNGRFWNIEFCSKACGASYEFDEATSTPNLPPRPLPFSSPE